MRYFVFVFALIFLVNLSATIINVPADQPSIQAGINVSVNGDTILVQPGTYAEQINYSGKNITVASLFLTTQNTTYISQTIIDGNNNERIVTFANGETEDAILTGFTVKNGYGTFYSMNEACGVGIYAINSSPTIEHNIIENNDSYWYVNGCGIGLQNSSAKILNNIIRNNNGAYNGGGIYVTQSDDVLIKGNTIYGHQTESGNGVDFGAGICVYGSSNINIEHNLIYNNIIDFHGGGIAIQAYSSVFLTSNTITENMTWTTTGSGAGVYCSSATSQVEIINSIIWENGSETAIQVFGENIDITYSDIQNGYDGIGNINSDPVFENPVTNNYNLTLQSPCINAGDPVTVFDPDGTIADIGYCYFDMSNYGTITGNVSLSGGFGNIENTLIDCVDFQTNPNAEGNYFFNLPPGFYNLTASLENYQNSEITNVQVEQGQITSNVDFILQFSGSNGVINVAQDGTGDFLTIQEGIETATDGDTILVHPGTYYESVDFIEKNIILASLYLTTQDSAYIYNTIIDGSGFEKTVSVENCLSNITQISGFTILNSTNYSNGLYCFNAALQVSDNIFTNTGGATSSGVKISFSSNIIVRNNKLLNSSYSGLIVQNSSNVFIQNNLFDDTSVGLRCYDCEALVLDNTFVNNIWGISGYSSGTIVKNNYFSGNLDGVSCQGFSPIIDSNYFINNNDGIYISQNSDPFIVNNLIAENDDDGIICLGDSSPLIINNTIVNNGEGISCYYNSRSPEIINCIIYNNGASFDYYWDDTITTISYCCVQDSIPWNAVNGGGNIFTDPEFATIGYCELSEFSPCIDAGIPDTLGLNLPETDLIGHLRIWDGDNNGESIIDMGCYEFGADSVNVIQPEIQNSSFQNSNLSIFPNPFNPSTTISFSVTQSSDFATIEIYNLKGQIVKTFPIYPSTDQPINSVTWNGKNDNNKHVASGIYLCKFRSGNIAQTRKMLLLK